MVGPSFTNAYTLYMYVYVCIFISSDTGQPAPPDPESLDYPPPRSVPSACVLVCSLCYQPSVEGVSYPVSWVRLAYAVSQSEQASGLSAV